MHAILCLVPHLLNLLRRTGIDFMKLDFIRSKRFKIALLLLVFLLASVFLWNRYAAPQKKYPRYLRIARDTTWPSIDLSGRDINMVAFTNELMLNIAELENVKIELIAVSSASLISDLDKRNIDAIMTGDSVNDFDLREYVVSDPIYLTGPVVVMRVGDNLNLLSRPEGSILAMRKGDTPLIEEFKMFPNLQVNTYDRIRQSLDDLINNQVDAVVIDAISAHTYANGLYANQIKIVTAPLTSEGIRLVALKGQRQEELMQDFNHSLKKMIEEGTYQKLADKWGLVNTFHSEK